MNNINIINTFSSENLFISKEQELNNKQMSKITNFYYVEKLSSELFEPILENYSQLTQAYLFQDRK